MNTPELLKCTGLQVSLRLEAHICNEFPIRWVSQGSPSILLSPEDNRDCGDDLWFEVCVSMSLRRLDSSSFNKSCKVSLAGSGMGGGAGDLGFTALIQ